MIKVKKSWGWHMPEFDTHYTKYFEAKYKTKKYTPDINAQYQNEQRDANLRFVKKRINAIDVGGNIGFWAKDLCEKFENVYIFEPLKSNRVCLDLNLKGYKNYRVYPCALGHKEQDDTNLYVSFDECGNIGLDKESVKTGNSLRTLNDKQLSVSKTDVKTLDSFNFQDIDFIKVDTQGHEFNIIRGAIQTINRCKPFINLELPKRTYEEIDEYNKIERWFDKLKYKLYNRTSKETIYGPIE